MKQTKLREPILYTSLWIVSIVIIVIIDSYAPISIFSVIIVGMYVLIGVNIAAVKRTDRYETRDIKKYILGKIKDIDDKIEELQEEKEELLTLFQHN